MGGKKEKELWQKFNSNLGNEVAKNEGEKRFRLEIEGEKKCGNWFVAMELPKIGEREYTYSYSKKYTYSYSLRVSVVFFTEAVWFVCMWCSFILYVFYAWFVLWNK